jgi:hypothetical protein
MFSVLKMYEIVVICADSDMLAHNLHKTYNREFSVEASGQELSFEEMQEIGMRAPNPTLNILGSTMPNFDL